MEVVVIYVGVGTEPCLLANDCLSFGIKLKRPVCREPAIKPLRQYGFQGFFLLLRIELICEHKQLCRALQLLTPEVRIFFVFRKGSNVFFQLVQQRIALII